MKKMIGLLFSIALPMAAWGQFGQGNQSTFEALDVDGNQKIDKEEAREDPRLRLSFSTYDSDGDGVISKREFIRFLGPRPPPRFPL